VARDPGPLRGVVIRACDRPAQLADLLRSLAEYERRFGARRQYIVLDDSHVPANARRNEQLLSSFAREAGVRTTHVDDDCWRRSVAGLTAAVPDAASAVEFALARRGVDSTVQLTGGNAWNLAALVGAGGRYVLLDEDNVLPLKAPEDAAPGLAFGRRAEAGTRFFARADAALAAGVELGEDPFEHALAVCGHSLAGAVAARPELAFDDPSGRADVLLGARVVTLTHGHRGASCSQSSHWMYLLEGESRESFWHAEEAYRHNVGATALWYGARRPFVQLYGNFTPFGVDATRMLPPTMPDGRGEDALFGLLVALLDPMSLALHSNLTIGHRQEGDRGRAALLRRPGTPFCNNFVKELLARELETLAVEGDEARLAALAGHLREAVEAPHNELVQRLRAHVVRVREELVRLLEAALAAAPDAPDYWTADVRDMIEVNRSALAKLPPIRFLDVPETLDDDACAELIRARLERFAAVLEAWPSMWGFASACDGLLGAAGFV
jgi:hypothetical protein